MLAKPTGALGLCFSMEEATGIKGVDHREESDRDQSSPAYHGGNMTTV